MRIEGRAKKRFNRYCHQIHAAVKAGLKTVVGHFYKEDLAFTDLHATVARCVVNEITMYDKDTMSAE